MVTWAVVIQKWTRLRSAQKGNREFLDVFWAGKSLDEIFQRVEPLHHSPIAQAFLTGYKELRKLSSGEGTQSGDIEVNNISRSLNKAMSNQMAALESHVDWLATIASSAPFIGLFGTVWGIMTSFQNIGATGSASLAVVAPGISEALIATAAGLAAAIPAAIGYNHFLQRIQKVSVDMDSFAQDFLNLVQRSLLQRNKQSPEAHQ